MLVKISSTALYSLVYLVTTELFPSAVKGTIFGMSNIFEGFGGMATPFIVEFAHEGFMGIFGVLSLIALAVSVVLKETKGLEPA